MPRMIAYLRVSTDKQDEEAQMQGILEYANKHGISKLEKVIDKVSGKKPWRNRQLGGLLDQLKANDIVLTAEVSRIGRSTLDVLGFLEAATRKKIHVHIVKNGITLDNSMQAKIVTTMLALCGEIERDFISSRTKEGLQLARKKGVRLGRPKGTTSSKLDSKHDTLIDYLNKGLSITSVAKLLDVQRKTVYAYMDRNKLTRSNRAGQKEMTFRA